VANKNDPSPFLCSLIDNLLYMREVHVIEGSPHCLCQVADQRIVRSPAATPPLPARKIFATIGT
jgi:hypothetical protein